MSSILFCSVVIFVKSRIYKSRLPKIHDHEIHLSVPEYLQRVKVEAAKKQLEKGRKTISEVMLDVGYTDDKAFREVFKKVTGLSPLDYRMKFAGPNTARPVMVKG